MNNGWLMQVLQNCSALKWYLDNMWEGTSVAASVPNAQLQTLTQINL